MVHHNVWGIRLQNALIKLLYTFRLRRITRMPNVYSKLQEQKKCYDMCVYLFKLDMS